MVLHVDGTAIAVGASADLAVEELVQRGGIDGSRQGFAVLPEPDGGAPEGQPLEVVHRAVNGIHNPAVRTAFVLLPTRLFAIEPVVRIGLLHGITNEVLRGLVGLGHDVTRGLFAGDIALLQMRLHGLRELAGLIGQAGEKILVFHGGLSGGGRGSG